MIITTEKGKLDKIHIKIDGEYRMTVDKTFWLSLGIREKSEVDEEFLSELEEKINGRRAFNKALEFLSVREYSRREIVTKLRQKGYEPETAESTADKLESYGYLDNRRFAEAYYRELKNRKKYGNVRIRQELALKGIDKEIIDEIIEGNDDNTVERAVLVLKKKYPNFAADEKQKNRAVNGLLRYGYSFSEIKSAMNSFPEQTDE